MMKIMLGRSAASVFFSTQELVHAARREIKPHNFNIWIFILYAILYVRLNRLLSSLSSIFFTALKILLKANCLSRQIKRWIENNTHGATCAGSVWLEGNRNAFIAASENLRRSTPHFCFRRNRKPPTIRTCFYINDNFGTGSRNCG